MQKFSSKWSVFLHQPRERVKKNKNIFVERTSFLIYLCYLLWTSYHIRPFFSLYLLSAAVGPACRLFCHYSVSTGTQFSFFLYFPLLCLHYFSFLMNLKRIFVTLLLLHNVDMFIQCNNAMKLKKKIKSKQIKQKFCSSSLCTHSVYFYSTFDVVSSKLFLEFTSHFNRFSTKGCVPELQFFLFGCWFFFSLLLSTLLCVCVCARDAYKKEVPSQRQI